MSRISRRNMLALLGGTALMPVLDANAGFSLSNAGSALPSPSLGALAAQKGIRFGSEINANQLDDQAYIDIFTHECAIMVPGNELKMYTIEDEPGEWNFAPGDALVAFSKKHDIGMRGHTLLWNYPRWLPDWVNAQEFASADEAAQFLTRYISRVASHYSPHIYSWDVINESFNDETGEIRESVFNNAMGWDVVDHCFHVAKEHAPQADLVYNDYMSWEDKSANHRDGVLRLMERLLANDVPIDGLGIQAHIMLDPKIPFTTKKQTEWADWLKEVSDMGLDLLFTEFDVNDRLYEADDATRDAAINSYARDYMDIAFENPNTKEFLLWGMVDHYSWLQEFRKEGQPPARPLPYDTQYKPKLLRETIADALRAAPVR
ncbi:endo-1,4-beta-xylanase [Parvularcula flava]|uniref:Beta-xylanase n=1 Tax=Aquisalinus luteolus TaxID=1566827 RepID=A0A8J3A075_9PROT|nr:endo-1,4-beta-xylanase [Aquisalinus luteolus]NHK26431.1 endo-1,4-beta-xylanase [Aquisalinus luteolus]GGH92313.1 beta-xylanase [Aquisalinus luteolus]